MQDLTRSRSPPLALTTVSGAHPTVLTGCWLSALSCVAELQRFGNPCFFNSPRALLEDTLLLGEWVHALARDVSPLTP